MQSYRSRPRMVREHRPDGEDVLAVEIGGLPKPEFNEALAKIKAMEGRRYNPDRDPKSWDFEAKPSIARQLLFTLQPEVGPDIEQWATTAEAATADEVTTQAPTDAKLALPGSDELFDFQRAGIDFLVRHPRAILADDMGLGKTVQAIGSILEADAREGISARGTLPTLVVTPNSVKGSWADEIQRWTAVLRHGGPDPAVVLSKNRERRSRELAKLPPRAWVIVNWEALRVLPQLASMQWKAKIGDEAHREKNKDAKQALAMSAIRAPRIVLPTGTPIMNSPDELWALLRDLLPEAYGSGGNKIGYWRFFDQYVEYWEGYFGKIITGVRNPDALRFELADKMIRRTKNQVLDLPEKMRRIITVDLNPKQAKMYKDATKALWLEIVGEVGEAEAAAAAGALEAGDFKTFEMIVPNGAARVTRLRQLASTPLLLEGVDDSAKLDAAVEMIGDNPTKQFVVFTAFKGTAQALVDRLSRRKPAISAASITGDVDPAVRSALATQFQAHELNVLVGTIAAMGVGLTLTAADTVLFLERDWVPDNNIQAEDRLHRIGQKNAVTVIIINARGTIDEGRIAPTNERKEAIVGTVLARDHVRTEGSK